MMEEERPENIFQNRRKRREFEVITHEERLARDPRGLRPVTIIGDSIIVEKAAEHQVLDETTESNSEGTEGGEQ